MAFDDSLIVRNATPIEGFRDAEFDYQLLRVIGVGAYGGSAVGECLAAAAEISDGSPHSWTRAFSLLAERVEAVGHDCEAAGRRVSARDAFLRASTYYRAAEYYAPTRDGRDRELGLASERCFLAAGGLMERPVEAVRIPFDATQLPGYFVAAGDSGPERTLVAVGGFDSTAEELWFHYGAPGVERGWNVLVVDGPGQTGCMRHHPDLPFRPDYEVPMAAVAEFLAGRPEVDPRRIALVGADFGGYFAARGAPALSPAALVVDPPVIDLRAYMEAWIGPDVFHMRRDVRPQDVEGVPEDLLPHQMAWGIDAICRRFGVESFHAWRDALAGYRLPDDWRPGCPVLALVGDREGPEPIRQFERFAAMAGDRGSARRFAVTEGTSAHTRADNLRLGAQVIFDWLEGLPV